ncbi:MAG: ATP-dependent helicase HrpB [Acidobacteria bacterium]|nr:ATP-dependent helicase HrpB [Acidobacteriota bacterium]
MIPLPIDPLIPEVLGQLKRSNRLVIHAPPGAGKTTRVPPALLALGSGGVLVLEPRRIAARLAARRVAAELGEAVGETVGYQVRFEDVTGPRTRLRFLTEGVLTRRLVSDRKLPSIHTVVLDEFHERHLDGDLCLALLLELQRTARPDLRVVVMSATLDTQAVCDHLQAPLLRSDGRLFPLSVSYRPTSAQPLEDRVAEALADLLPAARGSVLVFLPGAAEIRLAMRASEAVLTRHGTAGAALHGDLAPDEQDRAIAAAGARKAIFSTNVAESSVTIEGVDGVIDSGLARVASDSPWTGLSALEVTRISQASATQRAGRAGRTSPGTVIRLYPMEDLARRPAVDRPEIMRRELAGSLLSLYAMGVEAPESLPWLDAPPLPALEAAVRLLTRVGAVERGRLTRLGRAMSEMPLHPRLARFVLAAGGGEAARITAALASGMRLAADSAGASGSDVVELGSQPLDGAARRLYEMVRKLPRGAGEPVDALRALLLAFPDRVAHRRTGSTFALAGGGAAELARSSTVRADWIVAIDAESRGGLPLIRLASPIRPDWLLDEFPAEVEARSELRWNREAERVESMEGLYYGGLLVAGHAAGGVRSTEAAALVALKAVEAGVGRFADADEIELVMARAAFASQHCASPPLTAADVEGALRTLAEGTASFAELRAACGGGALARTLEGRFGGGAALLDRLAPRTLALPGRRAARIEYRVGQTPWVASRMQDFFGLRETPRIANGGVALVVHLLAPNQRPYQTTTDLAGFWERLYPQARRELARRYPRHYWPEDPGSQAG